MRLLLVLQTVNWQPFEQILKELGDRRNARIADSKGILEIVAPLPEHEITKVLIGDLVKILRPAPRPASAFSFCPCIAQKLELGLSVLS